MLAASSCHGRILTKLVRVCESSAVFAHHVYGYGNSMSAGIPTQAGCHAVSAGLHFTYPRDKRRALEQAAAERGDAARAAEVARNGIAGDPEPGLKGSASPRIGTSAAIDGTEMARLIRPHSHEAVVLSDA